MAMVYNVNSTATQVLAAKQLKENMFVGTIHRNGKGITEQTETNVSTLRMLKVMPVSDSARELGSATNGGHFNSTGAGFSTVTEYDLNLLYIYDKVYDMPEVQQDMVPVNILDATTKNIAGRIDTEINASTLAHQLVEVFNAADTANAWTDLAVVLPASGGFYEAIQTASVQLDNGDETNGIQAFPFDEREIIFRPSYRAKLLSANGVLIGGSNFAQSMLAKGTVSPDSSRDGEWYVGEIDSTPCYQAPDLIWKRAGVWAANDATTFNAVQAVVCAASATDRGVSTPDYIKIIDSPDGAGKRLQPKVRWGVKVSYAKGIVPILANGTAVPAAQMTIVAPASRT